MRQHPARPPNPQIIPASPVKAPAPCTKRSEPRVCLSIDRPSYPSVPTPRMPRRSLRRRRGALLLASATRYQDRSSVPLLQFQQSTCCALKKTCQQSESSCQAPTLKTCAGLSALYAKTGRIPSTTWIRLTGRPRATAWTSHLKNMNPWLILCGAVKGR